MTLKKEVTPSPFFLQAVVAAPPPPLNWALSLTSCPTPGPASLGSASGALRPSSSQGPAPPSLALGVEGSPGVSLAPQLPHFSAFLLFTLPPSRPSSLIRLLLPACLLFQGSKSSLYAPSQTLTDFHLTQSIQNFSPNQAGLLPALQDAQLFSRLSLIPIPRKGWEPPLRVLIQPD